MTGCFRCYDTAAPISVHLTDFPIADEAMIDAQLSREMAAVLGGRGGGKPAMAQGGGDDSGRIGAALEKARELLGGA